MLPFIQNNIPMLIQVGIILLAFIALLNIEAGQQYRIRDGSHTLSKKDDKPGQERVQPIGNLSTVVDQFQIKADEILERVKDEGKKQTQEIAKLTEEQTNRIRSDISDRFEKEKRSLFADLRYEVGWLSLMIDDNLIDLAAKKAMDKPADQNPPG